MKEWVSPSGAYTIIFVMRKIEACELMRRRTKFCGCRGDQFGLVLQHMGYNNDTGLGLFPLFLLDGLAHRGHGFGGIASIKTGSINLMFKPRAVGQAFRVGKFSLALDQKSVDVRERSRSQGAAAV